MAINHRTVTEAARAANQANGAKSAGPRTEEGKERSKMNALKHGQYAQRPTAAELLLADDPEGEQADREALRAETLRRYQPRDAFATQQAEELADLHFELGKIQRAQQAIWERERELLELEQRRRAQAVCPRQMEVARGATYEQVEASGLLGLPHSPGQLRELVALLQSVAHRLEGGDYEQASQPLGRVYGYRNPPWQGQRAAAALKRIQAAASDSEADEQTMAKAEQELNWLQKMVADELADARERLALCELEQGPLSPAGQAARLLEATHSRRWAWVWQRETFLRRSIDRKVRILIDLRRQSAGENDERNGAGDDSDVRDNCSPAMRDADARAPSASGDIPGDAAEPPGEPADDPGGIPAPEPAGPDPEAVTSASTRAKSSIEHRQSANGNSNEAGASENMAKPGNEPTKSFEISESSQSEGGEFGPSEGTNGGQAAGPGFTEPAPGTPDQP
jgi:hypothetical protein